MTTFDDRENAFELKYARDEELKFRVCARRDKLLGLWAAEKLGLGGEAADAYARSVISADMEEAGDEDVVRKLVADLVGTGVTEGEIRTEIGTRDREARHQIMSGETP